MFLDEKEINFIVALLIIKLLLVYIFKMLYKSLFYEKVVFHY